MDQSPRFLKVEIKHTVSRGVRTIRTPYPCFTAAESKMREGCACATDEARMSCAAYLSAGSSRCSPASRADPDLRPRAASRSCANQATARAANDEVMHVTGGKWCMQMGPCEQATHLLRTAGPVTPPSFVNTSPGNFSFAKSPPKLENKKTSPFPTHNQTQTKVECRLSHPLAICFHKPH